MGGDGLGGYLRSRRAEVSPADAGITSVGLRRVSGLRREEVALLAGISVDYYTRLEQGRERHPSPHVIEALAAALQLSDDAREHAFRLAGLSPQERGNVSSRVDPALLELVEMWPRNPAFVYNRAYDVLASNEIADAMFPQWTRSRNMLHLVFTDPDAQTFYCDWVVVAQDAVAGFRHGFGLSPNDMRVRAVRDELLQTSTAFADLWTRNDARRKSLQTKRFRHPEVGGLTLTMQTFDVRSAPGQELVVYHAEPGSASAEALSVLSSWAATR
jgi:transcriptional regulator with XRE-family HTH domain